MLPPTMPVMPMLVTLMPVTPLMPSLPPPPLRNKHMSKTQLPFSDDVINLFIFQNENKKTTKNPAYNTAYKKEMTIAKRVEQHLRLL